MINKLHLKDFQSHKDSFLEFSDNVNVIVGESDSGKSSIIRAIEWLRTNRPKGIGFINEEANFVLVSLEMDGIKIERERTDKSTGSYKIGKTLYEVMGQDVPEEIVQFMNLSDINIQTQLDNHFLVLDTPGKVAQYLNNITKLDKLTNAVDKLRSMRREEQRNFDTNLQDVQKIEQYLKSGIVEIVVDLNKIYNEVSEKTERKNTLYQQIVSVTRILNSLREVEKQKIPDKKLEELVELENETGILIEKYEELSKKIVDMDRIVQMLYENGKKLDEVVKRLESCKIEIQTIKGQLLNCPYCGQLLTKQAKERLLE